MKNILLGSAGGAGLSGTGIGLGLLGDRWRVKSLQRFGNEQEAKLGLPQTPPPEQPANRFWRR